METTPTYSVLFPDGTRHPAADLVTLNAWAADGRIRRETVLGLEGSNVTMAAATVPGLVFPADAPVRSQRERGMSSELRSAWICAGLAIFGGIVPCFARISGAAAAVGLFLAYGARRRGEPGATLALGANAFGLLVTLVWVLLTLRGVTILPTPTIPRGLPYGIGGR